MKFKKSAANFTPAPGISYDKDINLVTLRAIIRFLLPVTRDIVNDPLEYQWMRDVTSPWSEQQQKCKHSYNPHEAPARPQKRASELQERTESIRFLDSGVALPGAKFEGVLQIFPLFELLMLL